MVRLFRRKKDEEPAGTDGETGQPEAEIDEIAPVSEIETLDAAAAVDQAVERTRRTWFSRIGGVVRRGVGEGPWGGLGETLGGAGTGGADTTHGLHDLRQRVQREAHPGPAT